MNNTTNKKRILVVDDEKDLVEEMKLNLEENGFEVLTAYQGDEGLQVARRERPDLILLDLMLPKIDGYRVCALLKSDSRYADIPIILFTARAHEEDRKLGEEAGANAYLTKPYDSSVLLAKIRELIEKYGLKNFFI